MAEAADCKSVTKKHRRFESCPIHLCPFGGMADASDSKSEGEYHHVGSSPITGIIYLKVNIESW